MLRCRERVALFERLSVFAVREFPRLLCHLLDGQILQVGRQQMVIPRGRHIGRQEKLKSIVGAPVREDRKSTRLNSSHTVISYAVFCLKKKKSASIVLCLRLPLRIAQSTRP